MSDLAPDPRTPTDAGDAPDTEELLEFVEALVRRACVSPFKHLYDTYSGGPVVKGVARLVRAGRFRILWSEDQPGHAERHIGCFVGEVVDEGEISDMTRWLSSYPPPPPAKETDLGTTHDQTVAALKAKLAALIDRLPPEAPESVDMDFVRDQLSDELTRAESARIRANQDLYYVRVAHYAGAALEGLLANGHGTFQAKANQHKDTARVAWAHAHAHAMMAFDPEFGNEDATSEVE